MNVDLNKSWTGVSESPFQISRLGADGFFSLLLLVILLALLACFLDKAATEPLPLTVGQHQLFLDNFIVEKLAGVRRVMHQPEKRGALLRPDIPSDGDLVQVRSAPLWVPEEGLYKLYYLAYARDPKYTVGMALATSEDGIHWQKPILGAVEVHGSKENNWVVVDPALTWPNNAMEGIVYDPEDTHPERRYKALLGAENRKPVVSPDGIHWTRLGTEEIPSSDESQLVYDGNAGRYLAIVKTSNLYGRAFAVCSSTDFEHWTAPRSLFGADAEDQQMAPDVIRQHVNDPHMLGPLFVDPDPASGWKPPRGTTHLPTWRAEVYNVAIFPYEGTYLALPAMYYPTGTSLPVPNNTDGFDVIQLATSRDLAHWDRLGDRGEFIGPSGIEHGRVGVFDRVQLLPTNRPLLKDDELWFYYSGLKWRDPVYGLNTDGTPRDPGTLSQDERADLNEGWGAVCMAALRRDGFISLDADGEGDVLTRPVRLAGQNLFLNLSAREGRATVELLDMDGVPVGGFSAADAIPPIGDSVQLSASWRLHPDISGLSGRIVRLKIHLEHASLYSLWVE